MSLDLFSASDFSKEVAISHLPFTRDITESVPLKPDANKMTIIHQFSETKPLLVV